MLEDGWIAYVLWQSTQTDPSLGSWLKEHECLEVGEESVVLLCIRGRRIATPKNQGEEMMKVNLVEDDKEAQPILISVNMSVDMKQTLLHLQ